MSVAASALAMIDIPFRASITNRTRFTENISGVFPHFERRMYTFIKNWIIGIREFSLAKPSCYMSHYTMIYKNGERVRDFLGLFVFIVV